MDAASLSSGATRSEGMATSMSSQTDNPRNPERHFYLNYSTIAINGVPLRPIVVDNKGQLSVKDFPNGVISKLDASAQNTEGENLKNILINCSTLHENLLKNGFMHCSETLLYAVSIFQKKAPYVLCARDTYDRSYFYLIPILRQLHLALKKKRTKPVEAKLKKPFGRCLSPLSWRWKKQTQFVQPQILIFCPANIVDFLLTRLSLLCEGAPMSVAAIRETTDCVPWTANIIIADPQSFDPSLKYIDLSHTKYCVFDVCDVFFRGNNEEKLTLILDHLNPKCHRSLILGFLSHKSVRFINSNLNGYAALICGEFPSMTMFTRHTIYSCEDDAKPAFAVNLVNRFQGIPILIYVNDPAVKAVLANELRVLSDADQSQIFSRTSRIFVLLENMTSEERKKILSEFNAMLDAVLLTSDAASVDLEFQDILILINYDLPEDIETFVSRHGCVGRTLLLPQYYAFPDKSDKSLKLMYTLLMQHWKLKEGFNRASAESFSLLALKDKKFCPDLVILLNELQESIPPFLEEYANETNNYQAEGGMNFKEPKTEGFLPEFFHSELSLDVESFSNFRSLQDFPCTDEHIQ